MKKLALVIGILSILATSANAGYWSHTPQIGGGWKWNTTQAQQIS